MRESCTYGSMRGAPSNGRPYRNREMTTIFEGSVAELASLEGISDRYEAVASVVI